MEQVPVDIADKLSQVSEHWSPKVVARPNDYDIKAVKIHGEFVWHSQEDTDELFLVVDGELTIQMRHGLSGPQARRASQVGYPLSDGPRRPGC